MTHPYTDKTAGRRNFFRKVGNFMAGAAAAAVGCSMMNSKTAPAPAAEQKPPQWPLGYKKIDPVEARKRGYAGFYTARCSYGVFDAIIGTLAVNYGYPYNLYPPEMMIWGRGGGAGWAATCGSIIGGCTAINLVAPYEDAKEMVLDVFAWYEQAALPSDISNQMAEQKQFPVETFTELNTRAQDQNVSESPLCHVSVTRWCIESGFASESKERSERCARVTADVAGYVAELLNNYADGKFKKSYDMSAVAQECRQCHAKGKPFDQGGWARGKMQCDLCHDVAPDHFMKNQ